MKRRSSAEVAAYFAEAKRHGIVPSFEAFTARFPKVRNNTTLLNVLTEMGLIGPRPKGVYADPDAPRKRALKKMDRLQAQLTKLQQELAAR
jgi:hypothetical protein